MQPTFFFYDLETSGLSAKNDRIMQFAGQRTNLDLEPLGDPINIHQKMSDDTLPSPGAVMVTGITPQQTLEDGYTEHDLADYLLSEIFTPNTIIVGYNSCRFDDEFLRYLFWRTFHDPYEWSWKDGRSHWDILDLVRLTRAIRPEGINWPFRDDGKPTNRLELITKLNGVSHEHAHDALSDVYATIAVSKLIKDRQPELWDYLLKMRDKKQVLRLVNLNNPKPFVYASGRYSNDYNKTTVAFPLAPSKNGRIIVFDLRHNLDELIKKGASFKKRDKNDSCPSFYPIVKELAPNRCPAIAPLGVLEKDDGWAKLQLSKSQIEKNLQSLLSHPEFAEQARSHYEEKPDFPKEDDPDNTLYEGFLDDHDRNLCDVVHAADKSLLADLHPDFYDPRLTPLLLHYKARNYPKTLDEQEEQEWQKYRETRLKSQAPIFLKEWQDFRQQLASPDNTLRPDADFILEELKLWYESIQPYN